MDSSTNSIPCDVCSADENQQSIIAASHCKDCCMNLCKTCCQHHKRSKLTQNHKLVEELASCGYIEANESRSRTCEMHTDERLKIYCSDCKEPMCSTCYIENHRYHNWLHLKEAAEECRNQISTQVDDLSSCLADTLNKRELLRQDKETAEKRKKELEQEIHSQRDRLKKLIDKQTDDLLMELGQKQIDIDKDIGGDAVEKHLVSLHSCKDHCLSILTSETDDEICRLKDDLLSKVNELRSENKAILKAKPQFIRSLHFQPANLEDLYTPVFVSSNGNLLGMIKDTPLKIPGDAIFHGEVPLLDLHLRKAITGIAILEQNLYVVCQNSALVGVYATVTLQSLHSFTVHELTDPLDIASCEKNKCLYLIDRNRVNGENFILRIDLHGNVVNKWAKRFAWGWLSVSAEGNVISPFYSGHFGSISEFTSDGSLIRNIRFSGAIHALHAIKLSSDEFVCSHGIGDDSLHRVCVVDSGGNEKRCFGWMRGSQTDGLKLPAHLSVDVSDHVLVCDSNNDRVLLLNKELRFVKELVTERNGLEKPWRICFDNATGKLFVISRKKKKTNEKVLCFSFN